MQISGGTIKNNNNMKRDGVQSESDPPVPCPKLTWARLVLIIWRLRSSIDPMKSDLAHSAGIQPFAARRTSSFSNLAFFLSVVLVLSKLAREMPRSCYRTIATWKDINIHHSYRKKLLMFPNENKLTVSWENLEMNSEIMVANHAGQPVKNPGKDDPNSRTTSPTILLHSNHPDCAGSPLAQSQSTLSTTSPLSFDHRHYAHHNLQTGQAKSPMASSVPMPVRSASWAAPETRSPANSVPAIITTEHDGAPAFPSFKSSSSGKTSSNAKPVVATKRKQSAKKTDKSATGGKKEEVIIARKQKRLERNRESARLSRRRRKQYLEVLEDKVSQLSLEMDEGRRSHAAKAIETILAKRRELLDTAHMVDPSSILPPLETSLSRTSNELSVLSTFQLQQLKSFALPPHTKFVLWLTLQGDVFFRGGRAASERLSAARIGERMLHNGNDKATPQNSMWPLLCNEIALSYDQEEKVRTFQRILLQEPPSWLERHKARASTLAMQSFHDSFNAVATSQHQRERTTTAAFNPGQKVKFLAWAEQNAEKIRQKLMARRQALGIPQESDEFKLSPSQDVSANLYILNHRLQTVISQFPEKIELVNTSSLKRLSRRPSFESLGQQKDDGTCPMTRENSFASSTSLRRNLSSLSMVSENGEEKMPQQVSPEDGEKGSAALVEKELGFVKQLIPPPLRPTLPPVHAAPAPVSLPAAPEPFHPSYYTPAPAQQAASHVHYAPTPAQQQPQVMHHIHHAPSTQTQPAPAPVGTYQTHQYYAAPAPGQAQPMYSHSVQYQMQPIYAQAPSTNSQPQYSSTPVPLQPQPQVVYSVPPPSAAAAPAVEGSALPEVGMQHHQRKSSFLPPHLNVVPEEMFPTTGDAVSDDFLMSLVDDGDWAIGEGIDMDTAM